MEDSLYLCFDPIFYIVIDLFDVCIYDCIGHILFLAAVVVFAALKIIFA